MFTSLSRLGEHGFCSGGVSKHKALPVADVEYFDNKLGQRGAEGAGGDGGGKGRGGEIPAENRLFPKVSGVAHNKRQTYVVM